MLGTDRTLRKKSEFGRVFRAGKKKVGQFMVVYAVRNGLEQNRYGIVTSKKVGNAVRRNQARRRLREFIRKTDRGLKIGYDVVIIARTGIDSASFKMLEEEGQQLLKRLGLLRCQES